MATLIMFGEIGVDLNQLITSVLLGIIFAVFGAYIKDIVNYVDQKIVGRSKRSAQKRIQRLETELAGVTAFHNNPWSLASGLLFLVFNSLLALVYVLFFFAVALLLSPASNTGMRLAAFMAILALALMWSRAWDGANTFERVIDLETYKSKVEQEIQELRAKHNLEPEETHE